MECQGISQTGHVISESLRTDFFLLQIRLNSKYDCVYRNSICGLKTDRKETSVSNISEP
jgi:hypothetical protein